MFALFSIYYDLTLNLGIIGIALGIWIICSTLIPFFQKLIVKQGSNFNDLGMSIAHLGVGIFIIGAITSSFWQKEKITFVHIDVDTYAPTKFILGKIKPYLQKGSIILFDEFYGYPNWQLYEYKAFTEEFNPNEYKYIAFSTRQVAIEIL